MACDTTIRIPASADAALDLLKKVPAIRSIVLFGSRAMGDHDDMSDIDIAISAPDLDRAALARLRDAISVARTLYTISVTRLEDMPPSLRSRVLSQGRTVHERA